MTDQHDPAAPTADPGDQVWRWLLACQDCGDVHEYRRDDHAGRPWSSPVDGHTYRTRHNLNAYALQQLRTKWEREVR